jgi:hypothetical protein
MRNEQMKADAAIDRVLTGLAGVEAPTEMEQRVLKEVQRRATEQQGSRFVSLSTFIRWQPWAVAACVVVLSVAASVAIRKRHEPRHEEAVLNQHKSPNVAASPQIELAEARPLQSAFSPSLHRKNAAASEALSDEEALAISEMNAPSKPAPPLPLTHQEKLLAEAVHQDSPIDLSSLRPEVRAKQMELSKAEFHDFFEPPPTKNNE